MASQKPETFTEYLQRVASDMRESAIDNDSPTADDLEIAARYITDLHRAVRALVRTYNGPITPEFSAARSLARRRPLGKKLS